MVVTGAARRRLSAALVVVVAKVEIIPAHHHRWPYLGIDRKSKMNNMKPQNVVYYHLQRMEIKFEVSYGR